jgi:hypothetical protein
LIDALEANDVTLEKKIDDNKDALDSEDSALKVEISSLKSKDSALETTATNNKLALEAEDTR